MINGLSCSVMLREFYTFVICVEREEDTVRLQYLNNLLPECLMRKI